jgi:predicted Holliday junction resolvase-like endonuclease
LICILVLTILLLRVKKLLALIQSLKQGAINRESPISKNYIRASELLNLNQEQVRLEVKIGKRATKN